MPVFTNEMFLLAWARVVDNFPHLPEQLRAELEPYKRLVSAAEAFGTPLHGLAAQINEITVRHVRARLVPVDGLVSVACGAA